MLLTNKSAVVYGAGGAVGGAVARAFAREGATVFLAGRNIASVKAVADDIARAGGAAEVAEVANGNLINFSLSTMSCVLGAQAYSTPLQLPGNEASATRIEEFK